MTSLSSNFNKEACVQSAFDKARVIDMERTDLFKLLIGFSAGAATGLLLAPDSRKKVRSGITDAATGGANYLKACSETVRDAVLDLLEERKDDIARHKEALAEAIKRGTETYRRVVSEPAPSTTS